MSLSLPQQVYAQLRPRLMAGEFAPGDRLKYVHLAAQMGVSTTPVREAMTMLAGEGLVLLLPGTGAIVSQLGHTEPNPAEQDELGLVYGVREAIEAHATGLAASRISPVETRHLTKLQSEMRAHVETLLVTTGNGVATEALNKFTRSDDAFHLTIVEASGNQRLAAIARDAASHVRRLECADHPHTSQGLLQIVESHDSILAALINRDAQRARELMIWHLRNKV